MNTIRITIEIPDHFDWAINPPEGFSVVGDGMVVEVEWDENAPPWAAYLAYYGKVNDSEENYPNSDVPIEKEC